MLFLFVQKMNFFKNKVYLYVKVNLNRYFIFQKKCNFKQMKKQIVHIIILLFIVNIGISQSTTANKGKKSNNISVSKYDLILDKNTKEKIEPIKAESYGLPKIEISTKSNLYYNSYLTSSKKNKDYLSLLIAYELNPNVPEMYFELAKYYEINNNKEKKIEFCKKMENTILTSNLKC